MTRLTAVLAIVLGLLVLPGIADAAPQACQGRPGASAIEQYCEAIPDATGGRVSPNSERASSQGASARGAVPAAAQRRLTTSGQDGQAVLGLVAASASGSSDGNGAGGSTSGRDDRGGGIGGSSSGPSVAAGPQAARTPSDNPLKAVSSAVTNGATVGSAFVWALVGLALVALIVGWVGFRRRETTEQ